MGPLGPGLRQLPVSQKGTPRKRPARALPPTRFLLSLRPGLLVSLPPPLLPPRPSAVPASARALLCPLVLVLSQGPTSDHLPLLKLPRALYLPDTSWASQASAALRDPPPQPSQPAQNEQFVSPSGASQSPAVIVGLPLVSCALSGPPGEVHASCRQVRDPTSLPCLGGLCDPGGSLAWLSSRTRPRSHPRTVTRRRLCRCSGFCMASTLLSPTAVSPGVGGAAPGSRRAWGTAGVLLPTDPLAGLLWR